ncbi:MAG: chromosome segregation protein SMC [Pseudomonadota bacterium]|nr:chromosome segregation protein SMC [Pseudomonadota bacterium]
MRLSKIKLAGFKSFVEPTTILLPSNLIGVVGPNGCGKSNVIDAVRWVMGESSAKNLRGEAMTDVIFNGASNRKPVGQASIELFFDNADGAIGGQFASYGEVSVRRSVSRDGISQYYLNNVRCRRKDITGIFLGTGLGPRSYSIIEQGMISRLIEAKPEEMRAHLEEAAGISKYKERRRETENRIRHTRDNLDRLSDLREEIDNQLKHLDRQARAAERHKESKAEQRQVEAELLALSLSEADERIDSKKLALQHQQTGLESSISSQRKIESEIEQARQFQILSSDELNATQARHYSVDLEISHLEHSIEHNRATRERQQQDLEQATQQLGEISKEIDVDQEQLKDLDESLAALTPNIEEVKTASDASVNLLTQTETELRHWQDIWQSFSGDLNESSQAVEVERARIEQLELQQHRLQKQEKNLTSERSEIDLVETESMIVECAARETELRKNEEEINRAVQENNSALARQRSEETVLQGALEEQRGELDASRARLAALETLQQAALGGDEAATSNWLEQNQLDKSKRLIHRLQVKQPWQLAVETVLGDFIQAISVDKLDNLLKKLPDANIFLYLSDNLKYQEDSEPDRLLAQVANAGPASDVLASVKTAESIDEALKLRDQLASGESVITPDGLWLSRTWVRISRQDGESGGVLRRETEIHDLEINIRNLELSLESSLNRRDQLKSDIANTEAASQELHGSQTNAVKAHATAATELSNLHTELDKSRQRDLALGKDSQVIETDIKKIDQELHDAGNRLKEAQNILEALGKREDSLQSEQKELQDELDRNRRHADEDRDRYQSAIIELESRRSSRQSATTTLDRAVIQKDQLVERVRALESMLADAVQPLDALQAQLQEQLHLKTSVDEELRKKHEILEDSNEKLRLQEARRMDQEKLVAEARSVLDEHRMSFREEEIRRENISDQFLTLGLDLQVIQNNLPEDCNADLWQEKLDKIQRRLDRIGTVNLLAIDEFKEQSERAEYLSQQFEDLTSALETLEQAIRKIDRDTRARFQEVFENINSGLKRIFPRLFGGGHAYMSLEGDDLLNSGVTVMAQPPGKRNSNIHLLSGGEKALTAVALVFAIFELNPAPFCLLDEVDAPLDDANVGRFCEIVREISSSVQILFITHNKITMEMAGQLMGVTMAEPGVSRLVSVDIDEAVKLAIS